MGTLTCLIGNTVPFHWGFSEQHTFEEVKQLVSKAKNHHWVLLNYLPGADPIWMVTNGCTTGILGLISQGNEWKTARISAFYSTKLNPMQQKYPVHEMKMLAGVEMMLQYKDLLLGARFKWITDHKGLTYLLNQKNLLGLQAH